MSTNDQKKKGGGGGGFFSSNSSVDSTPHTNIDEITKILGYIEDEYKCIHNNFSGTLYTGPLAVMFFGRIFFFEWTVIIKWEDVKHVLRQPHGVRIEVSTPKPMVYDFEDLFNPEKVWTSLVSLHNDSIIDAPKPLPTPRSVSRSLRRGNSDPLLKITSFFSMEEIDLAMEGSGINPVTGSNQLSTPKRKSSMKQKNDDGDNDETSKKTPDTAAKERAKLQKAWSEIIEDKTSYSEVAVENYELQCNLQTFISTFIADDAKFSVPTMMEESGDQEINCSEWKPANDGSSKCRTIEYTHPINAPMAPPMARARKEQTYRQYGDHGFVMETETFVSDVPMTDCFYVADMIQVVQSEGNKVAVSMKFDIRFVKSTMFRTIITRTSKSEFQKFMQRLAKFMSKNLGEKQPTVLIEDTRNETIKAPSPVESSPPKQEFSKSPIFYLLVCILLLQSWILLDMRSIKNELRDLNAAKTIWTTSCTSTTKTNEIHMSQMDPKLEL